MSDLNILIQNIKNDDKLSKKELIEKFHPLLCKLSNQLDKKDTYNDLVICLLETAKSMPYIKEEAKIIKYIHTSLKNGYYRSFKKKYKYIYQCCELVEMSYSINHYQDSIDKQIIDKEIMKKGCELLTQRQKEIIYLEYYYEFTVNEISRMLGISRQAVYKHKVKGLNILRNFLEFN
jgi:RNA polymerase sigma factor (sigma-70 family)